MTQQTDLHHPPPPSGDAGLFAAIRGEPLIYREVFPPSLTQLADPWESKFIAGQRLGIWSAKMIIASEDCRAAVRAAAAAARQRREGGDAADKKLIDFLAISSSVWGGNAKSGSIAI